MGQDVSVVFVDARVPSEMLVKAARAAFAAIGPDNLVLMYGHSGPDCVHAVFPEFTAVTVWGDCEVSPAPLGAQLSADYGRALAFLMADHSCIGAVQGFADGMAGPVYSTDEDYTDCGIHGMEAVYAVKFQATEEERLWFTEEFLNYEAATCVFGNGVLRPGQALDKDQMLAIEEHRFEGAELECLLLDCGDEGD